MTLAWGTGRYYGALATVPRDPELVELQDPWVRALMSVQDDPKGAVTRAKDIWNRMVRDGLRSETGLKSVNARGEQHRVVPVRVVDRMPDPFLEVIHDFRDAEWAILNEATLKDVVDGTAYMKQHRGTVRRHWPEHAGPARPAEISHVHETAHAWLALLEKLSARERIVGINQDVLGAYFYHVPEIHLYWTVIGIVSRLIGVSIEALTVVVLAHELAHAYTHRGYDIDDGQWLTEKFERADTRIVEGLAQFYTKAVCGHLHDRMPEAEIAFGKLLEKQGPAYTSFRHWLPGPRYDPDRGEHSGGEIVRASMIECRKTGITDNAKFVEALERHRRTIEGR